MGVVSQTLSAGPVKEDRVLFYCTVKAGFGLVFQGRLCGHGKIQYPSAFPADIVIVGRGIIIKVVCSVSTGELADLAQLH